MRLPPAVLPPPRGLPLSGRHLPEVLRTRYTSGTGSQYEAPSSVGVDAPGGRRAGGSLLGPICDRLRRPCGAALNLLLPDGPFAWASCVTVAPAHAARSCAS